jgi:hypothetical protein
MTTLVELVTAEPDPLFGRAVSNVAPYTHVVYELADPGAGSSVEWFDITEIVALGPAGHDLTRGADEYDGHYRASVVHLDIYADDDSLAPWLDDTSSTFGTHVPLGAGLLVRGSLVTVAGGVVTAWNPRFTNKVERWGDASLARGQVRRHAVTARDLITSLVAVSVPESEEENWSDRVDFLLTQSAWPYGSQVYGAQFTSAPADILTVPARDAQSSALAELRATLDPAGLICYTDRRGVLIIRPRHDDTFHAAAFGAGASGTPWPGFDPVVFSNLAHDDPGVLDLAAFAVDTNQAEPFGFPDSEDAVRNRVVVTVGGSIVYDDDDPTSIQRHDPRELPLSWIAANNGLAATILATRAHATKEAVPLFVTENMHGFHPGPATLEFYQDVEVQNQTAIGRETATASGVLRQYRERMQPGVNTVFWDMAFVVDVHGDIVVDASLLPPEDLMLEDVSDVAAEFSWTNPTQVIDPTHTQVRMLNPASLWATAPYPLTGIVWGGLDPLTDYIFQVRYIREVDGLITHFSPSTTYGFTTLATTVPDWDGEDGEFPEPDPGCTLEWELQSSPDGVTWTTEDDGTIASPPWTLPDYDTTGLDPELYWRFRSREMCPGAGAWVIGPTFVIDCLPVAAILAAPFDDAVAYWPQICPPDEIREAISDEPATVGFAFGGIGQDADDLPVLLAGGEGSIIYGVDPVAVDADGDLSIYWRGFIDAQPDNEVVLFGFGGLRITLVDDGAGVAFHGEALEDGAGFTTISGPTEFPLGAVYSVALTHDVAAGDLILYVDAASEVDALGTVGDRIVPGMFNMNLPADSWLGECAVWDRVLDPTELPGYVSPLPVAGARLWLEARLITGLVDGNSVDPWPDMSGNGHDAVGSASAGTADPIYKTGMGPTSHPCIRFNGTTQGLDLPTAVRTGLTSGELFLVIDNDGDPPPSAQTGHPLQMGGAATSSIAHLPFTDSNIYETFGTNTRKTVGNPATSLARGAGVKYAVYNVRSASGAFSAHLDGTQIFTTATNTVGFSAYGPYVGHANGTTDNRWYDGDVALIAVFDHVLSSGDRTLMHNYINTHYGTTL